MGDRLFGDLSGATNSQENQLDNNCLVSGTITNKGGQQIIGQHISVTENNYNSPQTSTDRISTPFRYGVVNAVANFSGRVHELEELHKNLQDTSMTVLSQVIVGAGGLGKTQLATKYVNQFQDYYAIRIFLIAENVSSLQKELYKIAEDCEIKTTDKKRIQLPIKTILDDLYNKMHKSGRSIIVFDNVESIEDITPFLCNDTKLMTNIKTLITARIRTWVLPDYPDIKVIELDVWTLDEAQDFVKKCLLKTDLYIEEQAIKLCNCLGRYPLALRQAIGYIIDKNCKRITISKKFTIDDYLKAYDNQQKREELLSHSKKTDIYTLTVMNTWKLTAENLKQSSEGQLALKILEYLAYLLPDKIPCREIFETETNEDKEEAISILYDNCLLWKDGDNISIHRLLQEVVRLDIQDREESVLRELITILNNSHNYKEIELNAAAVWQKAAKYAEKFIDLYSKSPISPLLLILKDKNCDIDPVKLFTKIEMDKKNNHNIQKSLIRSIKCINPAITEHLISQFDRNLSLDVNYIDEWNYSAMRTAAIEGRVDLVKMFSNRTDCNFIQRNLLEQTPLLEACYYGNKEVFHYLMSTGKYDINDQDRENDTALTLAARSGNVDLVKIINNRSDCDFTLKNWNGRTALLAACTRGSKEVFEYLMSNRKYNINDQDIYGNTALTLAARSGNVDLVQIIINTPGCDVMHKNRSGETALLAASRSGSKKMFEYLMSTGKYNINVQDEDGNTPLILATHLKNFDFVRFIINTPGCDIMLKNRSGRTALLEAYEYRNEEVFEYLMSNGMYNINDQDSFGDTILIMAARAGNIDLVQIIVNTPGCDVMLKNLFGETALMVACSLESKEVFECLVNNRKYNINEYNLFGNTLLILAALAGNVEFIPIIVNTPGCDLMHKNRFGNTALLEACRRGNKEVFECLMSNGRYNINDQNINGDTALTFAASSGNFDLVQIIVNTPGCDVMHKNRLGQTALMVACTRGSKEMFEYLMNNRKYNINEYDLFGNTLLILAARAGNVDLVQIIVDTPDCNVMHKNCSGETGLLAACKRGSKEVFECLMSNRKYNINDQDENGDTALILAARSGNFYLVEIILNISDCDFMHRNRKGRTALLETCVYGKKEIFECLMSNRKYNINDQDENSDTALILAARSGNFYLVEIILNISDCDVMHKNRQGRNALLEACAYGKKYIFEYLMSNGKYNINDQDEDGNTALILTVLSKSFCFVNGIDFEKVRFVKSIISRPYCNLSLQNKEGKTALMIAREKGYQHIIDLLLNHDTVQ